MRRAPGGGTNSRSSLLASRAAACSRRAASPWTLGCSRAPTSVSRGAGFAPAPQAVTTRTSALAGRRRRFILCLVSRRGPQLSRSEDERHEHFRRALVRRVVVRELLG